MLYCCGYKFAEFLVLVHYSYYTCTVYNCIRTDYKMNSVYLYIQLYNVHL